MSVNKMLNTMRGEEDKNPKNKNSRRKYSYHRVIDKLSIVGIMFCLLVPMDARSLEIKPVLDSGNHHEKILEFKHRTSAGEKILHHIRLKRSQDDDPNCRKHVDREFMGFTRSFRAMGSKYQDLFKNIFNLKCIYLNLNSGLHNADQPDITICPKDVFIRIPLGRQQYGKGFENFKLNDRNIEDPEALGRYIELFNQFLPSLKNIANTEKNITSNERVSYFNIIKSVEKDWMKLQKDIIKTKKAYKTENCTIPYDEAKTKIPGNIVNPYTPKELQRLLNPPRRLSVPFTKEEIAASVFNQMLLVLDIMEGDLDHRRKCLE